MIDSTENKDIIWITGASTGIGQALTLQYASQGHQVIASARSTLKLEQLLSHDTQPTISVVPCDVVDRDSIDKAAAEINKKFGRIDKVIVNAGNCEYFSVDNPDWQMMARVMDVNYFGAINTLAAALPLLRRSDCAHIVSVASMASDVPFPKSQAYGSSKAAVRYFFESMRVDLAKDDIAVTVIQPGFVETPLTAKNDFPMPFIINAEQAAQIIIKRLPSKPLLIRFPRRLGWLLGFFSRIPSAWHYLATRFLVPSQAAKPAKILE